MDRNSKEHFSTIELMRKKLRYHIAKRANLEVETILSTFWDKWGTGLNTDELIELEKLLEMDDLEFLDIFWGKKALPKQYSKELFTKIIQCWEKRVRSGK